MARMAIHDNSGYLTLVDPENGSIDLEIHPPTIEGYPSIKDPTLKRIKLGPLPSPPLPMGLVIAGDPLHRRRPAGLRIDLDKSVQNEQFSNVTIEAAGKAARATPGPEPLMVDAYLPPHRMVDLDLLSRHANDLGMKIGRPIMMRVGVKPEY